LIVILLFCFSIEEKFGLLHQSSLSLCLLLYPPILGDFHLLSFSEP
jgi:hypothetical protein